MDTITQYCITPYVGLLKNDIEFVPAKGEVERLFFVPLSWLADPANYELRWFSDVTHKINRHVIFFKEYDGELVWGITGQLVVHLLDLLKGHMK
jgi:hypothetical protein